MFQTGGKPSTWFPSVGLVELYEIKNCFSKINSIKILEISKFSWKSHKMIPWKTIALRWKSHLHYHLMLIFSQKQTSIHEEHFASGTFSYQHGFIKEKHVQRGPRPKKSRCSWDGVYLRTSMATSGEPSTWFPLEYLVKQEPLCRRTFKFPRFFKIFEISTKM